MMYTDLSISMPVNMSDILYRLLIPLNSTISMLTSIPSDLRYSRIIFEYPLAAFFLASRVTSQLFPLDLASTSASLSSAVAETCPFMQRSRVLLRLPIRAFLSVIGRCLAAALEVELVTVDCQQVECRRGIMHGHLVRG